MRKFNVLAFALLISTAGCVTGPPVESQRERRVERSLENGVNHHDNRRVYYEGYRNTTYDGYPYNQTRTHTPYHGYREVYVEHDNHRDPMGNYDQDHDRKHISGY